MKEFRDLIWKLIDRAISDEEFDRLQGALLESAELRRLYQESLELEEVFRGFHPGLVEDDAGEGKKVGAGKVAGWVLGVGALVAACVVLILTFTRDANDEELPVAGGEAPPSFRFTAWKSAADEEGTSGLAWEIRERALHAASITLIGGVDEVEVALPYALPGGVLEVTEGWVEVTFPESAVVRLEAPTTFEIISSSSGYLYEGNVVVSDDGDGESFDLFHSQGKVVDIGTAFAMRVEKGDSYNIFVIEGEVDNYDGNVLALNRLRKGDLLAGREGREVLIKRIAGIPSWVAKGSRDKGDDEDPLIARALKIQTATWLRGELGGGVASGSLSGVGVRVTSDACHNSGEVHSMGWAQYLKELLPARDWYHAECASIGALANPGGDLGPTPVVVEFQGEVKDPLVLFGWGEKSLRVNLSEHELVEKSFLRSHPSIQMVDQVIDFGSEPGRQNIPGQMAGVQIKGVFGPGRPLVFELHSSNDKASTLSFSLGLVDF